MQLTYFVMNKGVQWYNSGTTVPIFHMQTEAPDADSWCEILRTRTMKNEKLLFTYANTVVKKS